MKIYKQKIASGEIEAPAATSSKKSSGSKKSSSGKSKNIKDMMKKSEDGTDDKYKSKEFIDSDDDTSSDDDDSEKKKAKAKPTKDKSESESESGGDSGDEVSCLQFSLHFNCIPHVVTDQSLKDINKRKAGYVAKRLLNL